MRVTTIEVPAEFVGPFREHAVDELRWAGDLIEGDAGYAVSRGELALNPCDGIRLPAVRGRRERIADPVEAASLIAAAPAHDCATWATAMYAGLRLGELQALRAESIDLAAGVIHVERGWDAKEGEIELKTRAGRRKVPIPAALRDHLLDHLAHSGRAGAELVFGGTSARPFDPSRFRGVPTGRGAKPGSSGSHRMSVGIPSPR